MNLTYINVTVTGKVLRWKLYLKDKDFDLYHVPGKEEHQFVPDALSRLCENHIPPPPTLAERSIVALRPVIEKPQDVLILIIELSRLLIFSFLTRTKGLPTTNNQHVFKKRYQESYYRDRSSWPGADPGTERE